MTEKILYYLGAGASAQALPLVKDSPDGKVKGLAHHFRAIAHEMRRKNRDVNQQKFLNEFAIDLEWLAKQSESFSTIDTFAKHLYLTNREELKKLKLTLSIYFSLEQLWYRKLDNRYLIWLTSILEKLSFPDHIKVLTWNYDFQMELSAEQYRKEALNYHNGIFVHSPPLLEYYPPIGNTFPSTTDQFDPNRISLIHLNGIAGFYSDSKPYENQNLFLNYNHENQGEVLNKIINDAQNKDHLLTFAWETDTAAAQQLSNRLKFAEKIIEQTTIVVVIGYSFPFFNRKIDKAIFSKLKSANLKKIYFQDPFLDGSFLENQFELDTDVIDIVHIKRLDSFFIPFEL